MRVRLLCVGKERTKYLDQAIAEYGKRLRPTVRVEIETVPASETTQETNSLLKRIVDDEYVILLDERGVLLSTPELAERIQELQNDAVRSVSFVVGGAHGVSAELRRRADMEWSLSPLVFPHELVRLVVMEQLYRAHDILRGGKYHHG
ncbi:23S rRNA (pseudouridine(1915)-N(3))-methyltransferase RlmH [Candidatus Saccharibacteria bacterium]|nr:23S rRNA (pseudouridine(1915)-N(3))-methyltransferase RlmH [Candidatus Saccharibacteria bacterium]